MKSFDESAKSSTTDKIEGNAKIASGALKGETGRVFHSPKLQGEGIAEKSEGHVQKKIGEIKTVLGT